MSGMWHLHNLHSTLDRVLFFFYIIISSNKAMPLTAEQGYKIREEYSDIKEKEVCDAHGLTQIGGSRTKIDGTDGVNNTSIKNMWGTSA